MKINEINESIYSMNPEEPMNPEVLIQGYGGKQSVVSDSSHPDKRLTSPGPHSLDS